MRPALTGSLILAMSLRLAEMVILRLCCVCVCCAIGYNLGSDF